MLNNDAVDVVTGLIFIYLLYSLLATAIQEVISTILHRRANTLYAGIKSMLSNTETDRGFIFNLLYYLFIGISQDFWNLLYKIFSPRKPEKLHDLFYENPIIKNYGENRFFKKPSYLTPENFSTILIETIKNLDPKSANTSASIPLILANIETKQKVKNKEKIIIDRETRDILLYHLNEAAGDLDVFKARIERWYNDSMDRVSGWYKRNTQFYLTIVGITLAIILNIDSIEISKYLSSNRAAREQLAQMGVAAAGNHNYSMNEAISNEALDTIKASINKANTLVGLGWNDYGRNDSAFRDIILKKDRADYFIAYEANKEKAQSLFSDKHSKILLEIFSAKYPESKKLEQLADSLRLHRNDILKQQQFSLLYDDLKFKNSLERAYVWYRLRNWEKFFGLLISALAIGLGAPLWFDLLNKFASLRTAVKTVNSSGGTTSNNSSNTQREVDG